MDWLKQKYEQAKSAITGPANTMAASTGIDTVVPPGTAPEAPNTTVTGGKKFGGRRHRKTMKGGRKSRKTYRRKH
jgi:hypothetical protein